MTKMPLMLLLIMVSPYLICCTLNLDKRFKFAPGHSALWGLGALLCFTGIGHFLKTEGMAHMVPRWIPYSVFWIYISGALEFALGLTFFFGRTRRASGIVTIVVLVLLYPFNVYAAIEAVPFGGHEQGLSYLLIRTPLQIAIVSWAYCFAVRRPRISVSG